MWTPSGFNAGIMPAIITPMDANGDLDEHAFEAVME
jgi:dihydrodipicolinate synthase/N-acetylneuraminate lyase